MEICRLASAGSESKIKYSRHGISATWKGASGERVYHDNFQNQLQHRLFALVMDGFITQKFDFLRRWKSPDACQKKGEYMPGENILVNFSIFFNLF